MNTRSNYTPVVIDSETINIFSRIVTEVGKIVDNNSKYRSLGRQQKILIIDTLADHFKAMIELDERSNDKRNEAEGIDINYD